MPIETNEIRFKGGFRGGPRGPRPPALPPPPFVREFFFSNISALQVRYGIQAFAKFKRLEYTRLHLRELQSEKFCWRSMHPKLPRKVCHSQSWCLLALYTTSLGPLYHKNPHPPLRFVMPCNLHLEHTYINKENDCKGVVWCVFGQLYEPVYCYTNCN